MSSQRVTMTVNGADVAASLETCGFCSRQTIFPVGGQEDKLQRERVQQHVATDADIQRALVYDLYPCAWCGKFSPEAVATANEAEERSVRQDHIRWWKTLAGVAFVALVPWAILVAGVVQAVSGKSTPIMSWIMYPILAVGASLWLRYVIRGYRRFLASEPATADLAALNADDRRDYWLQFASDLLALRCDPTGRPVKGSDDPTAPRPWKR